MGSGAMGSAQEPEEDYVFKPVLDTENGVVVYQPPETRVKLFVVPTIRGVKIIQPPIRSLR